MSIFNYTLSLIFTRSDIPPTAKLLRPLVRSELYRYRYISRLKLVYSKMAFNHNRVPTTNTHVRPRHFFCIIHHPPPSKPPTPLRRPLLSGARRFVPRPPLSGYVMDCRVAPPPPGLCYGAPSVNGFIIGFVLQCSLRVG